MAARWFRAVGLVLTLQTRAYFPHFYVALALATVLVFRFVIPSELIAPGIPVLLLGEQGVVSIVLVGVHLYLERNEGSGAALAVTPLRSAESLAALVFASSVLACVSGAIVWAGVVGIDFRVALLIPPLLLLSIFSALAGVGFATLFGEFTSFLMGGVTTATNLLSLPLLSYFAITPAWSFLWLPSDWALNAFALILTPSPSLGRWFGDTLVLVLFCGLAFWVVLHLYETHLRYRLDSVDD